MYRKIAHRGNLDGPNPVTENTKSQVDRCIKEGYDVEIDVRYDSVTKSFWLGHDEPKEMVNLFWLASNVNQLWIHCKDFTTLHKFADDMPNYNFFWHQGDDYTLTSKKNIWSYPGKPYSNKTVIVMPEETNMDFNLLKATNCYGICTDYPTKL